MSGWHDALGRFSCMLFFERVALRHAERVPPAGPVLFLGLHRNGAVDGFVYNTLLPGTAFLVSSQLRENPLGRVFFTGIEVRREKDAGAGPGPEEALARCADILKTGGRVFLFPEGTSSLGPRHLPFRSGPARLLHSLQESETRVTVVPLAILYDDPARWRSSVEVAVGEPFEAGAAPETLTRLRERVRESLESVSFEFESAQRQESLQGLARLLCRDGTLPYSDALRTLSQGLREEQADRWEALRTEALAQGVLFYKGAPGWEGPRGASPLRLALLAAPAALAAVLNLPPLLAGFWAGRRFPDGPNVVALWKILAGVPAFLAWALLLAAASLWSDRPDLLILYALATVAGLHCWSPAHRSAVSYLNGRRHRPLLERIEAFRTEVFQGRTGSRSAA